MSLSFRDYCVRVYVCACVFINAGAVIGFDPISYVVNETDGTVTFTVKVLNGTLERSVFVTFFTSDGSATSTAPADFQASSNVSLEFNSNTVSQQVSVTIIDDDILENPEIFLGNLDEGSSGVTISQRIATVTILEQEGDDGELELRVC